MFPRALIYSLNHANIEFYRKSINKFNAFEVTTVSSYEDFFDVLSREKFNITILDLDLDYTDGITVIKELRQEIKAQVFSIICSNKADDFVEICALNAGADEFICFPIKPIIFGLRINAILKRSRKLVGGSEIIFQMQDGKYQIDIGNSSYILPKLDYMLLELLFSNPYRVFSKKEILRTLWEDENVSSARIIDVHICNIRKLIGPDIVNTYRGLGYSFNHAL